MPFDFVNSPSDGQQVTGPNGSVYQWSASRGLWAVVTPTQVAAVGAGNVGRNLLHNAQMAIAQRGTGPFTASGAYTADRWMQSFGGAGAAQSVSVSASIDADRSMIGDEACNYNLAISYTGTSGASDYNQVLQFIEGVRRLGGKTVIISFWSQASASGLRLGVSLDQTFGTGGSPSATVNVNGQSVAVDTSWSRQSVTLTLPSTSGKTLGTAGNDCTGLHFWFSAGSTYATLSGNVGVHSGGINLWGVQLEVAAPGQTQPTALVKLDPGEELRQCQRFFSTFTLELGGYGSGGGFSPAGQTIMFPVTMRAPPTIAMGSPSYANASGLATASIYPFGFTVSVNVASQGQFIASAGVFASADL